MFESFKQKNKTMCNITGKIIVINDEQQVTDSFKKRSFVVETTTDQHPQSILLELHQTYVDLIDAYEIGQEVTVSINIRGKAYAKPLEETKYFNSLVAWKIQPA